MLREEQIKQQADKYIGHSEDLGEDINITIERIAFIEGAKWADKNPNLYNDVKYHTVKVSCLDELNRKAVLYDKFLEKACEYLYLTLYNSYDEDGAHIVASKDSCFLVEFIEDFKKYIEDLK